MKERCDRAARRRLFGARRGQVLILVVAGMVAAVVFP